MRPKSIISTVIVHGIEDNNFTMVHLTEAANQCLYLKQYSIYDKISNAKHKIYKGLIIMLWTYKRLNVNQMFPYLMLIATQEKQIS